MIISHHNSRSKFKYLYEIMKYFNVIDYLRIILLLLTLRLLIVSNLHCLQASRMT